MKYYTSKTLDDAIAMAVAELGVSADSLNYQVIEEKKTLFRKTATIAIFELADAIEYSGKYIKNVLDEIGIKSTIKTTYRDSVIKILINSDNDSLLIGKNGKSLQALTEITRLATYAKFRQRYKLIVEVADYKSKKYKHIIFLAKKVAREVLETKSKVKLDPMTSDERRVVHNTLSKYNHIETESVGEGKQRAVTVKYVD